MAEGSFYDNIPANLPESVRAKLAAARLMQQTAMQQTAPYTSKGVVALKGIEGLLGGLQERSAIDEAQQGQADQRRLMAQLLLGNIPPGAAAGSPSAASAASAAPASYSGGAGSDAVASGTARNPSGYDPKATEALIRSRAPAYGIDPDAAVRIARSEGLNVYHGDGGSSFGPFQLHYGGVAGGGNAVGGLGDAFTKKTGLDARDPSTVPQQVDFALQNAAQGGWGPWHGRKTAQMGVWDGIGQAPKTAAGQLAATPGSDAVPKVSAGNTDPGINVPPTSATTLAGGQGADSLANPFGAPPSAMAPPAAGSADSQALAAALRQQAGIGGPSALSPSPFGAMPTSMDQSAPAGADPMALAAALRASTQGATPSVTPPGPDVAQPPVVPPPQGDLTASSPFGAPPSPMAPANAAPNSQALAAALRQQVGQQAPTPAVPSPSPQDPTGGLSPAGLQMAAMGGGDPAALAGMAQAAPPVSAAPLSTDNAVGFDNLNTTMNSDGTPAVTQSSLGAPGFTGAPADGSAAAAINGSLPGPQAYVGGPMGLGTGAPDPMASPSSPPAMLAQALRQNAPTPPTPAPTQPQAAPAPVPPPSQVAALPSADDPLGGLMGTPGATPPSTADITTAAMAKAGYDTTGLTGAMPPQGSVAGLGPAASIKLAKDAAANGLPMLAGANVPSPDLSGLGAPTTPPSPGAAMPLMATDAANPPAVLAQALRASSPAGPSMRPAGDTSLPETGPVPPSRPSDVALGLDQNAPAPGASNAGPAPVPPGLLAQVLRQSQPNGLPGDGGADPSSPQAFMRQEAQRAAGGASPSMLAQAMRGNSPATASASAPAPASSPADSSPFNGLSRLFNFSGAPSNGAGGNPLSGLPIIGDLFGGGQQNGAGPNGQAAGSSGFGGQGQAQPFNPGGQGGQPGQAGGGQGAGLNGMSQAQMLDLLSNKYTSPQDAALIMQRLAPSPMIEKTSDGKIVSIDPRGGPARVLYSGQGYRPATADERKAYGVTDDRPFTFGPDGKPEFGAVDPNAKETTEVRDYNMVVKQARDAGQTPPTFSDYQTSLRRSGAASVTIDQKAENAEAQARGAGLGKRLNDVADDSSKVTTEGIQVSRIRDLLGSVDTGPGTAYAEKFRQATGVALDPKTDKVQALQAAIQNLAPALRVPGSGSQSDTELKNFQASIPGLMNTPGGNEQILRTLEGAIAYRQQRSAIAQQWQVGKIDAQTADAKISALPSPFASAAPSGSGSSAPASAPAAPQAFPQATPAPQGGGLGGGYLPGAARPQAGFTAPPTASAAPPQAAPAPSDALAQAQAAIARGAPRAAVIQRLQAAGINPAGL